MPCILLYLPVFCKKLLFLLLTSTHSMFQLYQIDYKSHEFMNMFSKTLNFQHRKIIYLYIYLNFKLAGQLLEVQKPMQSHITRSGVSRILYSCFYDHLVLFNVRLFVHSTLQSDINSDLQWFVLRLFNLIFCNPSNLAVLYRI